MSTMTLEPCPFCGAKDAEVYPRGRSNLAWNVCCGNPGCVTRGDNDYLTKSDAVAAWNRRAHLAKPAQAVDVGAIREVIADLERRGDKGFNTNDRARCNDWADKLTRAISSEKAGLAGEWEAAFHAQRAAAMRSHTVCYETMLAHPEVAELGDDGRLHDAIHDILRVDGPASPAPDKEGL